MRRAVAVGLPALLVLGLVAASAQVRRAEAVRTQADDAARADALAAEVRRLKEQLADAEQACAAELERLRADLFRANDRRAAREYAWYEYNRMLAELQIADDVPPFAVDPEYAPEDAPEETDAEAESSPRAELARQLARRAADILISLRHLLMIEEIRGIDLLEVGALDGGAIGPAVFRLLDDRGRLAGGLSAERLRLEASRAGHTVTLVLENGFESRGGDRIPFDGGVRRIVLPYADPEPWIQACPELFPASQVAPILDDGRWDAGALERTLNPLLRDAGAANGGYWRVNRIEGVLGDTLQLVQLELYASGGALERRVFADRMTLRREGAGVRILLRDGISVRAASRTPFVGGVFQIFLPRADGASWSAAKIPGLGPGADAGADGAGSTDGVRR
jgi:hypothetical protein